MRSHPALWLITVAFIGLGLLYSVITPAFESPDESYHFLCVKHIADGQGLPVQPGSGDYRYRQEGSQPPLYYLLGAAITFWIDTGPPQDVWQPNPQAQVGWPHAPDNKNIVIHNPKAEAFPYGGVYLAVHLLRLLTVLIGAGTVALTYLIAWEVAPRRAFASGVAALAAFNPTFIFIAASVNNDVPVTTLSSAALFLLLRLLKRRPSLPSLLLLGLVLGLASLTKLSALGLWPLTGLALAYVAYRRGSLGLFIGSVALVGLVGASLAGWWYWRNLALYGEPLGLSAMLAVAGVRCPPKSLIEILPEIEGVFISYWALFGWANIVVSDWFYRFIRFLLVPAAAVGLLIAAARVRQGQAVVHLPSALLLGVWLLLIFGALIRWTQLTPASFGRLLFPAIACISAILFLGLESLVPRRAGLALAASIGAAGFGFALAAPFLFIIPAYAAPPIVGVEQVAASSLVYVNYDDKFELLGYDLSDRKVQPGEGLKVTLYLRGTQQVSENYSLFVHLVGPDGRPQGQWDSYPGGGAYPTSLWQPGEIIKDSYTVVVTPSAKASSQLWVEAGFYLLPSLQRIPSYDRNRQRVVPRLAPIEVLPPSPPSRVVDVPIEECDFLLGHSPSGDRRAVESLQ